MRNIVVVDCQSTGINFIDDIYNRRYNPVVLELIPDIHEDIDGYRQKMDLEYERSDYAFDLIHERIHMKRHLKWFENWTLCLFLQEVMKECF